MATTSYKSRSSSSSIVDETAEMYSKLSTDASTDEIQNLICSPNVETYAQMYDTVRQKFENAPPPDLPENENGTRKRPTRPTKGGSVGALTRGQSTSDSISSASSPSMEAYEMDLLNGNKVTQYHSEKSPDERMIEVFKQDNEPLGMTVMEEKGQVQVARILVGSIIEKQDLLHVGDVILAVDGQEVKSPEAFIAAVKRSSQRVIFKIIPSFVSPPPKTQCYLRTLFSYDPLNDTLIPCKELGLSFLTGEVLEILNREDPNWWQARRIFEQDSPVGLIPSQDLEEMRRAFVDPELDYSTKITICGTKASKKKKKQMYQSQQYSEFERAELQLYEEVCRMPPFERKTLVLIGAKGVGRRTLKARLIAYDSDRFAAPIPHTSRPIKECELDGKQYHFVKREIMDKDIANGKYLEFGDFEGHLFGTKLDSIRAIIRSGKMCIIDCQPQCLKLLKTKEFMPFVVFIAAPAIEQLRFMHEWGRTHGSLGRSHTFDRAIAARNSKRGRSIASYASFYDDEDLYATIDESQRLFRMYETQFDLMIPNNNFESTFEELREAVDALSTEPQWVPISWVYSE